MFNPQLVANARSYLMERFTLIVSVNAKNEETILRTVTIFAGSIVVKRQITSRGYWTWVAPGPLNS